MNSIALALSYDDVLLVPQYSEVTSRSLVDLSTNITPNIKLNIPITSANMNTVTGVEMAIVLAESGGIAFYPRFESIEDQVKNVKSILDKNLSVIPAVGIKEEEIERAKALIESGCKVILVDVAHGHLKSCLDFVSNLRKQFVNVEIVAGNVATYEAAKDLFEAGADCVKVGVGPGSICTTRIVTGSGVPQLTAILEAAKAAKEKNKYLIADGGIKNSGDIVKALAAGANAVMLGNILAGTDESPGDLIEKDGRKFKKYNGSTSIEEKKKYTKVENIEGVAGMVPHKGSVKNIISSLEQGIKSGLSYSGAFNINEFQKKAEFVQITSGGLRESGAHDITPL